MTNSTTSQNISVIPAQPEDAEDVRSIQAQTWYATYVNPDKGVTLEGIKRRVEGENGEKIEKKRKFWRDQIETSGEQHAVYLAKINEKTIGFVAPGFMDGQRRIGALYVLPEAQGMRVGSKLLERALAWHGSDDVYLHVAEGNEKAIKFYEKFGFKLTGKKFDDDGPVDARIPEYEMARNT